MIKKDLLKKSAKKTGFTISETKLILDSVIEIIKEHIKAGDVVTIKGLGTFKIATQKVMVRKNINTGELFTVPEKKKIIFKPSSKIDVNKISILLSEEVNEINLSD